MRKQETIEFENQNGGILSGVLVNAKRKNQAVLMCAGFERCASTEWKFRSLASELSKIDIPSFRFDQAGLGFSDGTYTKITVARMSDEIVNAVSVLQEKTNCKKITVVAHSLAACAIAKPLPQSLFNKVVLIAPALNQKELFRYWFAKGMVKEEEAVTWQNYQDFIDEEKCLNYYQQPYIDIKYNRIANLYFLENMNKDYSDLFTDKQNVLYIHGDQDDDVPMDSLKVEFKKRIIVKGGDHDLEKPKMIKQWLGKAVDFIRS